MSMLLASNAIKIFSACSFPVECADDPETGRRIQAAFLRAAMRMHSDGWWWAGDAKSPLTAASIKKQIAGEFAFTFLVKIATALGFRTFGEGRGIIVGKVSPQLIEVPASTKSKSHLD